MRFTEYDQVIQALSPDRTDEPFDMAILPRRAWCYRMVTNSHGLQPANYGGAVAAMLKSRSASRDVKRELASLQSEVKNLDSQLNNATRQDLEVFRGTDGIGRHEGVELFAPGWDAETAGLHIALRPP